MAIFSQLANEMHISIQFIDIKRIIKMQFKQTNTTKFIHMNVVAGFNTLKIMYMVSLGILASLKHETVLLLLMNYMEC